MSDARFSLEQRFQLTADCKRAVKENDIDVVILNTLQNLVLADTITLQGVVIFCANEDKRAEYEVSIQHAAIDLLNQRKAVMGV